MKGIKFGRGISRVLLILACVLMTQSLVAQVYKSVDENGNVVYSDQPPEPGADPADLPDLSVVEAPSTTQAAANSVDAQEEEVPDRRALRRIFSDFRITSPQPEENLWNTSNSVNVSWMTSAELLEGMTVTIFIDGIPQDTIDGHNLLVEGLDRGEHQVQAELTGPDGRLVSRTDPVLFYIKQNSVNFNNSGQGG